MSTAAWVIIGACFWILLLLVFVLWWDSTLRERERQVPTDVRRDDNPVRESGRDELGGHDR